MKAYLGIAILLTHSLISVELTKLLKPLDDGCQHRDCGVKEQLACRLTCQIGNCSTICGTTTIAKGTSLAGDLDKLQIHEHNGVTQKSAEELEPFEAKDNNPFDGLQATGSLIDASSPPLLSTTPATPYPSVSPPVTPLTISEAELEKELLGITLTPLPHPPPSSPTPPKTRWVQKDEEYYDETNTNELNPTPFPTILPPSFFPPETNADRFQPLPSVTPSLPEPFPPSTPLDFSPPAPPPNAERAPPLSPPQPPAAPPIQSPGEELESPHAFTARPPGFKPEPPGFSPLPEFVTTAGTTTLTPPPQQPSPPHNCEDGSHGSRDRNRLDENGKFEYSNEEENDEKEFPEYNSKEGGRREEQQKKWQRNKNFPPPKKAHLKSNHRKIPKLPKFTPPRPPKNRPRQSSLISNGGCPPPKICGRNCGIYIDERSCQSCQCLWISTPCTTDLDCRDVGQFCDLGRCECATGYIHDETQSGVCRFNSTPPENGRNRHRQQGIVISSSTGSKKTSKHIISGGTENSSEVRKTASNRRPHSLVEDNSSDLIRRTRRVRRRRRVRRGVKPLMITTTTTTTSTAVAITEHWMPGKPLREERLQWPGPCETDDDCPPNLYCLDSDCWAVPEMSRRNKLKAKRVEDDKNQTSNTTVQLQQIKSLSDENKRNVSIPTDAAIHQPTPAFQNYADGAWPIPPPVTAKTTTAVPPLNYEFGAKPPAQTPPPPVTKSPESIVSETIMHAQTTTEKSYSLDDDLSSSDSKNSGSIFPAFDDYSINNNQQLKIKTEEEDYEVLTPGPFTTPPQIRPSTAVTQAEPRLVILPPRKVASINYGHIKLPVVRPGRSRRPVDVQTSTTTATTTTIASSTTTVQIAFPSSTGHFHNSSYDQFSTQFPEQSLSTPSADHSQFPTPSSNLQQKENREINAAVIDSFGYDFSLPSTNDVDNVHHDTQQENVDGPNKIVMKLENNTLGENNEKQAINNGLGENIGDIESLEDEKQTIIPSKPPLEASAEQINIKDSEDEVKETENLMHSEVEELDAHESEWGTEKTDSFQPKSNSVKENSRNVVDSSEKNENEQHTQSMSMSENRNVQRMWNPGDTLLKHEKKGERQAQFKSAVDAYRIQGKLESLKNAASRAHASKNVNKLSHSIPPMALKTTSQMNKNDDDDTMDESDTDNMDDSEMDRRNIDEFQPTIELTKSGKQNSAQWQEHKLRNAKYVVDKMENKEDKLAGYDNIVTISLGNSSKARNQPRIPVKANRIYALRNDSDSKRQIWEAMRSQRKQIISSHPSPETTTLKPEFDGNRLDGGQTPRPIFYDYSARNRLRRPIRVGIKNAKSIIGHECTTHADCGGARLITAASAVSVVLNNDLNNGTAPPPSKHRLLCCLKRWCDLSAECGMARFCLPDCRLTKMTYLSWAGARGMPLLDLIYD